MSKPTAITMTGLGKCYDRPSAWSMKPSWWQRVRGIPGNPFWALSDVNLTIREGEVVGILGRNGAGKSTLLKILSRITLPTTGEVRIHGRIGSLLEVGTGFNPDLSGHENIYLSGVIHGLTRPEIDAIYDQIVAFSGVEEFIHMPVKHYSSGMYTRLGYAVAAHLNHDILLIDEVLAVGDAEFQRKCMGHIHGQTTSGRTVLFVSHNTAAILGLCTRAIWLDHGRVIADGPPLEVVDQYLARLVTLKSDVSWPADKTAPGNDAVRLRAVRMVANNGTVSARHMNDQPFHVEIEYDVLRAFSPIGTTIAVHDTSGTCLFGSISNHEPNWHGKAREPGRYISRCTVPGDLMKEGVYALTVIVWSSGFMPVAQLDLLLDFEIVDSGKLRGDYFGGWEGYIQPRLPWHCDKIA